jgi:hypothetical protein
LGALAPNGDFFALVIARYEHLPIYKAALDMSAAVHPVLAILRSSGRELPEPHDLPQ